MDDDSEVEIFDATYRVREIIRNAGTSHYNRNTGYGVDYNLIF
jgi:hypothetical protein